MYLTNNRSPTQSFGSCGIVLGPRNCPLSQASNARRIHLGARSEREQQKFGRNRPGRLWLRVPAFAVSRASLMLSAPSLSRCSYQVECFSTCLQERSKCGGFPPTFVPRHLCEDLEGLLPAQRGELACLQLRTHRDVWQDGDAHSGRDALLHGLYALELHRLCRQDAGRAELTLELSPVGAPRLWRLWQQHRLAVQILR